jgi:2-polyprenyl-3-methyl-5-hydroxy-6-metoxy-1,4-benzoquinol methylase
MEILMKIYRNNLKFLKKLFSKDKIKNLSIYNREPISIKGGIPIFSSRDIYIENYEKIWKFQLKKLKEENKNPWIEEDLWKTMENSTRDLINKHVPLGGKILDVGVGQGRLLSPLKNYKKYGCDIAMDCLEVAKKTDIDVAFAKVEEIPYKRNFFDAIVVTDILEHVLDLNFCSEKFLSCLKPGGLLFVRVPFKEDTSPYLDENNPYKFVHLRSFDESTLRLHFEKIFGLKNIEHKTVAPYLQGTPRLKIRLLPKNVLDELQEYIEHNKEFSDVANAFKISEESFQDWIYKLQSDAPPLFKKVCDKLILGIEINSVFKKPLKENIFNKKLKILRNNFYK